MAFILSRRQAGRQASLVFHHSRSLFVHSSAFRPAYLKLLVVFLTYELQLFCFIRSSGGSLLSILSVRRCVRPSSGAHVAFGLIRFLMITTVEFILSFFPMISLPTIAAELSTILRPAVASKF